MSDDFIAKFINSEIQTHGGNATPINYLLWINDLKMFGEKSYVFRDSAKILALATDQNSIRDPIASGLLLDAAIYLKIVGIFFGIVIGSMDSVLLNLHTVEEIASSQHAMNIILSNDISIIYILRSEKFMTAMGGNVTIAQNLVAVVRNTLEKSDKFKKTNERFAGGSVSAPATIRNGTVFIATGADSGGGQTFYIYWIYPQVQIKQELNPPGSVPLRPLSPNVYSFGGYRTTNSYVNITFDVFTMT